MNIFKKRSEALNSEDKKLQQFLDLFAQLSQIKKNKNFRHKYFSPLFKPLMIGGIFFFSALGAFISPLFLFMAVLYPFILFFLEIFSDSIKDNIAETQTHALIDNFLNSLKTKEDIFSLLYSFQQEIHSYGAREEYNAYGEQLITNVKQILQHHLEHVEVSKIYELCYNTTDLFESFYQKALTIVKKEDFNTLFEAFVLKKQEGHLVQEEQDAMEQFQINKDKELVKYL